MGKNIKLRLPTPTEKQKLFLRDRHKYVAYGGARGGGKSWAIRIKSTVLCMAHSGITVCIVRRTYPELMDNHITPFLKLLPRGLYSFNLSRKELRFINGSKILFRYCSCDADIRHFQGVEFDVLFIDEATQFTESQFKMMVPSVRGINNFPKRIYLTCNPGGVGHAWVKRLFVDRDFREGEDPEEYSFIQARVYDNKELIRQNPDYIKQLEMQNPEIREAWLEGKWDLAAGRFFHEFNREVHVCEPFAIPKDWRRYRAFDYGLDMFACLWVAVAPTGDVYVYRESCKEKLAIWQACENMRNATGEDRRENIYLTLAPPDMWGSLQESGKTRAAVFAENGVNLTKVSNNRAAGWACVRELLRIRDDGTTRLHIFSTCPELIRCLPQLQYDEKDFDDVLTEPHDITHAPDALRYFSIWWFRPEREKENPGNVSWTEDMWEDYRNASPSEREYLIQKWGKPK